MRRRARAVPFARRRLSSVVRDLKLKPAAEWSQHLRLAQNILVTELSLSEGATLSLLIDSVSAAHECSQAISERSDNIVEFQTRTKLYGSFRRIANCVRRAPARFRRHLDEQVSALVKESTIDLEVVGAIFDAAAAAFWEFPECEASKTALRELCGIPPDHDRVVMIESEYATVGQLYQRKAEHAIAALAKSSNSDVATSESFDSLAAVFKFGQSTSPNSEIHDLIVQYIADVAALWRAVGVRPSRATHPENPGYTSGFHRFVDLVLTAMIVPWAQRHVKSPDDLRDQARRAYLKLPKEARQIVSSAPRRGDIVWVVSDDHLKKALRAPVQKTDRDTP